MRAAFDTLMSENVPAAAAELDAAFAADMDLSAFLHARGVNMRYLPQVAARCANAAARQFLEQETIVRGLKHTIRALWARHASSAANAAAIAAAVIAQLQRGELWAQLQPEHASGPLPPAWPWEPRLRAAIGLLPDGSLAPKVKSVRPPPFVPLGEQEAALLRDLEFRRATGADAAPVQLQLVSLYLIWAAGDDPRDSFAKGEAVLREVLERHRRGPPVKDAIAAAARWHYRRGQYAEALALDRELLEEQRATLGSNDLAVAATLNNIGVVCDVRARGAGGRQGGARRPR